MRTFWWWIVLEAVLLTWGIGAFGQPPQPGAGGMPSSGMVRIGEVSSIAEGRMDVDLIGGGRETVELFRVQRIAEESIAAASDIQPGVSVVLHGHLESSGTIQAISVVRMPEQSLPPIPEKRPGGPWIGRIMSISPYRLQTVHEMVVFSIDPRTRILSEQVLVPGEIKPGRKVRLIGPPGRVVKVVALDSLRIPEGGLWRDTAPEISNPGRTPTGRNLPLPPPPMSVLFDRATMDASRDSCFGFKDPFMFRIDLFSWFDAYSAVMNDLGISWMEPAGPFGMSWNEVQHITSEGEWSSFDWTRYDRLVQNAQARNIHLSFILHATEPISGRKGGYVTPALPGNMKAYQDFIRKAVDRYNLDGKNDMPGLLYPVTSWKVEDEAMAVRYFKGSGSDYAKIVIAAYEAIKSVDPAAVVILSMLRGYDGLPVDPFTFMDAFFREISLSAGNLRWDVMDHHWMAGGDGPVKNQYREIKRHIEEIRAYCVKYGLPVTPIWVMETAGVYEPERDHAVDLVKRFVYSFSLGVRKVFWSGLIEKRSDGAKPLHVDPFEKVPLMDPEERKKPAYYSLQKLVSVLDGFETSRTRILKDEEDVILVEFFRKGFPVWVGWSDKEGGVSEEIHLPPGIQKLVVMEMVPLVSSPANKPQEEPAFKHRKISTDTSHVLLHLTKTPVVISVDTPGTGRTGT